LLLRGAESGTGLLSAGHVHLTAKHTMDACSLLRIGTYSA
jgi:hypothetical protein